MKRGWTHAPTRVLTIALVVCGPSLQAMESTPAPALPSAIAPSAAAPASFDMSRADVQQFTEGMAKHGFATGEITALLSEARSQPRILEAIQRPAERTLAWWEYRQRFLTEERVNGGVRVWQQNAAELTRIAAQTGVPAEYLIAITGVETLYGRITGRYRVLDALATLAFDYPPRADFFRAELEQFLLMSREEKLDPRLPVGSYAGAMGIPQFMPSSFRRFAVDGDGDGRRDLWTEGPDVFASIGNYLREHGWLAGQPVLAETWNDAPPDSPASASLTLAHTLDELRARGYVFDSPLPGSTPVMLLPAQLSSSMVWRIGYANFYAITRYNRSALYGMAVHELARAIATRYQQSTMQAAATP